MAGSGEGDPFTGSNNGSSIFSCALTPEIPFSECPFAGGRKSAVNEYVAPGYGGAGLNGGGQRMDDEVGGGFHGI